MSVKGCRTDHWTKVLSWWHIFKVSISQIYICIHVYICIWTQMEWSIDLFHTVANM